MRPPSTAHSAAVPHAEDLAPVTPRQQRPQRSAASYSPTIALRPASVIRTLATAVSLPRPETSQAFESPLLFRHFSFWTGILGATTMLDTDATVTTGLRPSIFDRLPTGFGDPDQTDLDRLAASLDDLTLYCREFATDEPGEHPAGEAVAVYEQILVSATRRVGEQL